MIFFKSGNKRSRYTGWYNLDGNHESLGFGSSYWFEDDLLDSNCWYLNKRGTRVNRRSKPINKRVIKQILP